MKLPKELSDKKEWAIVGPLGPELSPLLLNLPILAVDGGARFCSSPHVWVGDADSYSDPVGTPLVLKLSEDKDASDFSFALGLFDKPLGYTFHLWGFSGGRKDHELFVWGEALSFLENHPESGIILYNQKGVIEAHFLGAGHWRLRHQGLFSVGCLRKIRIRLSGDVKYPLTPETWLPGLTSWGLSNEASGEFVIENDGPAFLYYPEIS